MKSVLVRIQEFFRRVLRERLAEIPHVLTISLYFQYVSMSQVFH